MSPFPLVTFSAPVTFSALGMLDRMVMNYDTGELAIALENGPAAGAIKTLFKKDKVPVGADRESWFLAQAKSVIQQGN